MKIDQLAKPNMERCEMRAIVATLKEKDQDFEWYPTTNEILECVKIDMVQHFGDFDGKLKGVDVLDCGAGDGRVLEYLTGGVSRNPRKFRHALPPYVTH